MTQEGKFIVFEGIGGCGKSTQYSMASDWLVESAVSHRILKFPRYDHHAGYFVNRFRQGLYGNFEVLSPKLISVIFGLERFDARQDILRSLNTFGHVLLDRYDLTNMAYHAARFLDDSSGFEDFVSWIIDFEKNILGSLKPDLTFIFNISEAGATRLSNIRNGTGFEDKDILEEKRSYISDVAQAYIRLSQDIRLFNEISKCVVIECEKDGALRSINDIHEDVKSHISNLIGI